MIFRIDTDAVRSMTARFRSTANAMETSLIAINQGVKGAGWQSQAREEFVTQLALLQSGALQSAEALRMMAGVADEKAGQWEAVAKIFNGPFQALSGLWNRVKDNMGWLWGRIKDSIGGIRWPSLPRIVFPVITGGAIVGWLDSIRPDWSWQKPGWWPPFGTKPGSSQVSKTETGAVNDKSPAINTPIEKNEYPEINYSEIPWSERINKFEEYQKELLDIRNGKKVDEGYKEYLEAEFDKISVYMNTGVVADGPSSKSIMGLLAGCTNYVSRKRNIDGFFKGGHMNAQYWNENAKNAGYNVGSKPVKGSILVIEADKGINNGIYNSNDSAGHVAYVESVEYIDGVYRVHISHGDYTSGKTISGSYEPMNDTHIDLPYEGHADFSFIYDKPG